MRKFLSVLLLVGLMSGCSFGETLDEARARVRALYGENKKITGDYDKSLAVKCVNGTFVGKKNDGVIAYKGIPFVGKQPVGELRWKAPVDVIPDDGVYEAYYNAKSAPQAEDISEGASLYVQGEDCLYLNIWKADETPTEKWESCSKCQALGLPKDKLQARFTQRVFRFLTDHGRRALGWDEILDGAPQDAMIMSWRGSAPGTMAASQGHDVVMAPTSHCYFDYQQVEDVLFEPSRCGGYIPIERV